MLMQPALVASCEQVHRGWFVIVNVRRLVDFVNDLVQALLAHELVVGTLTVKALLVD